MTFSQRIYALTAVILLCACHIKAQDRPIGYWRSHLPYNSPIGIATDGSELFVACDIAFFTLKPGESSQPYSKTDGMSDIGMRYVAYDASTYTAILVYTDGNIDLFKDNTFYNIPDLKIKTVAGIKDVNNVFAENGTAYLSTSLGILVIDLANYNISETYQFYKNNQIIPVTSFTSAGSYFYATTTNGLYRADRSSPELQNFQVWTKVDTSSLTCSAVINSGVYLSNKNNVYTVMNDTLRKVYTTTRTIQHIDAGITDLLICEYNNSTYRGAVKTMNVSYQITDSFACLNPAQALQVTDNTICIADVFGGVIKQKHGQQPAYYGAIGPNNVNSYDIYAHNKNVWVAHGGYTSGYNANGWGYGMSNFHDDIWDVYAEYRYPLFGDSVTDISNILKDEKDGTVYAGSFESGLCIIQQNGSTQILKQNSIFDTSRSLFGAGQRQVMGLTKDNSDNIWVSLAFAQHQICVKTPDSIWYEFSVPGAPSGGPMVVDDNGQIWFVSILGGGVGVYNTNGTLDNTNDDNFYRLTTGVGFGNLPSNNVYSIAKDKNNSIWIGTDNGIGIVSNCLMPFSQSQSSAPPCDADIPIVQYDKFAGYLFAGNNVKTIAVDGANRKWVGTDNGVWLLSSDASQIIYRFTTDNSPLPSNSVRKIAIDDVTGDVYIGTDQGLVSYHSTATNGETSNQNVLVFPDPVPSGYKGIIAIKGLAANADVRITDINGQLVYRTKALGGQAVWSGFDYKGHRPQTGVYLIFASNSSGAETYAGKIIFMQ